MQEEIYITWHEAGIVVISAISIYIILIIYSRLVGPRSFARLTAFDFAVTVAPGAIVGATSTGGVSLIKGIIGLSMLFLLRWIVARSRRHGLGKTVDNAPLLLIDGPEILPEYLKRGKIIEADLLQSLRKKGITNLKQVRAVVMERDGSISVLRTDDNFDDYMLKGVKGNPTEVTPHVNPPLNN